jgi:hypothetical protein
MRHVRHVAKARALPCCPAGCCSVLACALTTKFHQLGEGALGALGAAELGCRLPVVGCWLLLPLPATATPATAGRRRPATGDSDRR